MKDFSKQTLAILSRKGIPVMSATIPNPFK